MSALASDALCGISDVKETLGITTNTQDNLIIRKINQATKIIQNYCDNTFSNQTYTETYNGSPQGRTLVLRHSPVISLTSLSYRNTSLNESNFSAVDTNLYFLDNNSGSINFLDSFWGDWSEWQVVYSAGYSSIPADVSEACVTLACYLFQNPISGQGVHMIQEGARRVQYQMDTKSTNLIERLGLDVMLDTYTDIVIAGDR